MSTYSDVILISLFFPKVAYYDSHRWDYQLNGKHRAMGQTALNTRDVTAEPVLMRKKISDPNTGKAVGEVKSAPCFRIGLYLIPFPHCISG